MAHARSHDGDHYNRVTRDRGKRRTLTSNTAE